MNRRTFLAAAFGCSVAKPAVPPAWAYKVNWFIAPPSPATFVDYSKMPTADEWAEFVLEVDSFLIPKGPMA